MTEARETIPPALLQRIKAVGATCVLAGLTAAETIEALNVEARKHGLEYRVRRQ